MEPIHWGGSGNTAIGTAEATWGGVIATRDFKKDDGTAQTNPCTGSANVVQWVTIDGVGRILATASVCINLVTRAIVGFVIEIDKEEPWTTSGVSTSFDVENVISHEFGHVAGLGHVNAPKDGCLTMYAISGKGETHKRTLGLGDQLGMDVLYNTDVGGSAVAC